MPGELIPCLDEHLRDAIWDEVSWCVLSHGRSLCRGGGKSKLLRLRG